MRLGHGGRRTGAGRKPGPARPKEIQVVEITPEAARYREPPADLPEGQLAFWIRHASLAIDQGTLTRQTANAFRLLCELEEEKQAMRDQILREGRTYVKGFVDSSGQEHLEIKAHPLVGPYRLLAKQVETMMARFKLAPFGKPENSVIKRAAAVNPYAALTA